MGQGNRCQSQGAAQAPTISKICHIGQGMGRGRGQDFQAGTSGTEGRVYAVVPQTELTDQYDIQGTFRLSHFLIRVLLKCGCIIFMLIVA